ncbi:MAG: AGE family epimerase/isomerase [Sphingobium sp.]|nr:AGE family epimerase/isomerase [Sphingobium sp.]
MFRSIQEAQTHAKMWLFDVAGPLWSAEGVCPDGLFAERLTLDGQRVEMPRRMRVQARQIYSFATIGQLGWSGPWQMLVSRVIDHLIDNRCDDGTFVHLFGSDGRSADERSDLYNQAFGLFALAHAAKALNRSDLLDVAQEVTAVLETKWARAEGGFWEGEITPCPPFRQNPHMHMFEAFFALYQASGREIWQERLKRMAFLFRERFHNAPTGAVTEYFDQNWSRLPGDEGRVVEPGHCFEWAWLFETEDNSGVDVGEALGNFARRHGLCPRRGVAINEISLSGDIVDASARLWPQTERLKHAVVRHKRLCLEETGQEIIAAYSGLVRYFDTPCPGVWRDRWLEDGQWVEEDAPASSFYHIVCGLNELLALG